MGSYTGGDLVYKSYCWVTGAGPNTETSAVSLLAQVYNSAE